MTSEVDGRRRAKPAAKRAGRGYSPRSTDSEFVNYELTQSEVAEYRAWRNDLEAFDLVFTEALDNGYRFSAKYDDYSSSYSAFMFPDEGSDNSGFILTGRGGSGYRALSECLFKHSEVFRGAWHTSGRGGSVPDDPDW